ncbi:MAG: LuxR C-terminal-related transcriptional regulator [Chloroflexota bacterium]
MVEQYPSLLVTKLYIPRLRPSNISRGHLLALLDAGLERKLTLIAAAAGFGKTTLVAQWCSKIQDDVCWLSLDSDDNDPTRFLSYLIAALQTRRPHIAEALLAALQSPQPPPLDHALPVLLNQIAPSQAALVLVLDDYHVIENRVIHTALTFLLDHLPPQVHILLLTRTDPPLQLAGLRAKHDLLELRAAELRFSAEETEHFLNQSMKLALSIESIRALETRTEGWIAGLQLAALALESLGDNTDSFVENFTGSHRFVLDYLMEEVLSHQDEPTRRFLLQTAILRRLNGDLCGAVIGIADGQAMLENLERHNLFLIPLDQSRGWYRYHHLFADLLAARLQAEYSIEIPDLRRRAAHWHDQHGFPEEAVSYALAAGDFDYAASLICGTASGVSRRGEVGTLLDWYRQFPADFVANQPRLCLYFGLAFALNGRWEEAETLLRYVESHETHPDEALMLAYLVASYRQDVAQIEHIAQTAAANPHPAALTKMVLGLAVSLRGDWRAASALMAEAQQMAERDGDAALALTTRFHRCRFLVFAGDLHSAHDVSLNALKFIHEMGGAALPMATFAHVSLGRIFIEWNDLEQAAMHLEQAIQLGKTSGFMTGMISSATMMLAEVKQARGDGESAIQIAREAITYAVHYDPPSEVTALRTYQARIWLAAGNISDAVNWLHILPESTPPVSLFYPPRIHVVTQARALLAMHKTREAIPLLMHLMAEPRDLLTVEAIATLALARTAGGDSVSALSSLERALTLGYEEHRIRAFLDLGQPMAKLLTRFCAAHPEHEFGRSLLALFPAESNDSASMEFLSDREMEVLRLIAAGHSNDEIAAVLTLAVSTVKWYINALYSKLNVKTRTQAIARAHELKLLVD